MAYNVKAKARLTVQKGNSCRTGKRLMLTQIPQVHSCQFTSIQQHFSVLAAMGVAEIDDAATVRTIAREKRIVCEVVIWDQISRASQVEENGVTVGPPKYMEVLGWGWGWNEHDKLWLDHTNDVPKPIKICYAETQCMRDRKDSQQSSEKLTWWVPWDDRYLGFWWTVLLEALLFTVAGQQQLTQLL
ncbi:hypothetical protein F4604DRAFT_1684009 [Suillus subluteus]|nr:hypothetical protein F4604DRAFT_1684009 [Suillus subluteus]